MIATAVPELVEHHLPMSPWGYGIVAFALFMGLLFVAAAFRSVWTRH